MSHSASSMMHSASLMSHCASSMMHPVSLMLHSASSMMHSLMLHCASSMMRSVSLMSHCASLSSHNVGSPLLTWRMPAVNVQQHMCMSVSGSRQRLTHQLKNILRLGMARLLYSTHAPLSCTCTSNAGAAQLSPGEIRHTIMSLLFFPVSQEVSVFTALDLPPFLRRRLRF